ncbi:MAG: hypothetical protein GW778_01995 [Alphaproteobacteria bacterium]|nr:hypothetical protein [Alphaproteobacteria bacterium]
MKTLLNTLFICVAGISLSACADGLGNFENEPPYSQERTAQDEHTPAPVMETETVIVETPAPMCKPCEDCSAHKSRIATLESELAACREASNRVRDAYTDTLKK